MRRRAARPTPTRGGRPAATTRAPPTTRARPTPATRSATRQPTSPGSPGRSAGSPTPRRTSTELPAPGFRGKRLAQRHELGTERGRADLVEPVLEHREHARRVRPEKLQV